MKRLILSSVLFGLVAVGVGCDGPKSAPPSAFSPPPQGIQSVGGGGTKPPVAADGDVVKP